MDITKKYQKLTQIEHVLKVPGMYIGSIEEIEDLVWILKHNKIVEKNIKFTPGLYKIFDEILVSQESFAPGAPINSVTISS